MIQSGLRRRTRIDAGEMRRFARARKIEAERADSARCQTLRDLDVHSEWTGTRNEAGVGQDQYRLIAGASAGQHADEAVVGTETLERLHDQAPSARQACAMSSTTPYSLRDRNIARSMPMPSSKRGASSGNRKVRCEIAPSFAPSRAISQAGTGAGDAMRAAAMSARQRALVSNPIR